MELSWNKKAKQFLPGLVGKYTFFQHRKTVLLRPVCTFLRVPSKKCKAIFDWRQVRPRQQIYFVFQLSYQGKPKAAMLLAQDPCQNLYNPQK